MCPCALAHNTYTQRADDLERHDVTTQSTNNEEAEEEKEDSHQWLWRFLGITGQNPDVSKSNWLHVVIFRLFFTS
jgi:hypothetical protein